MSSRVILQRRPYIFSCPLLLTLRKEITTAAVALFHTDLLSIDTKPISDLFTGWTAIGMSKMSDLVSEGRKFLSK